MGLLPLLTERERLLIHQLDVEYRRRYNRDPAQDDNLFYFLGDRFEFSFTWTAASNSLPTFRKNPAKFLHRASGTCLSSQEKLASLGWPVTSETAQAMGTVPLPSLDAERADRMAGNSMHLTCAAKALLIGMCCFGPGRRD